jgi:hypothetical protein
LGTKRSVCVGATSRPSEWGYLRSNVWLHIFSTEYGAKEVRSPCNL